MIIRVLSVFIFVFCNFLFPAFAVDRQIFEIPDGLVWMNSSYPIKLSELKGKFVVVYFWSYAGGGIKSVIDQCHELQEKFPRELVVIGIHTGKALNNDVLNDHVADALADYRVRHPIAIDDQMLALRTFRFNRFPSAVLIAPDGSVLYSKIGQENLFYFFNKLIIKNIPRYQKIINETKIDFQTVLSQPTATDSKTTSDNPVDLSSKVMQPNLMGNVVLDSPPVLSNVTMDDINNDVDSYLSSEVVNLASEKMDESVAPSKALDLQKFYGQNITIDREYSQKISQIKIDLTLPQDGQLLKERKSFIRIWSDKQTVLAQQYLQGLNESVTIQSEVMAKELFVELVVYYCTHSQKSVCLIKNMLFVVPLVSYDKWEDIDIRYNISETGL